MSFIRPEAQEQIWRWREAIAGAVAILLGLWLAVEGIGFAAVLGTIVMVIGIALTIAGWQRARFRRGRDGAGVVHVTEGQVTYYGPFTGGAVAIASIYEVVLNPMPRTGPIWEIRSPGNDPIHIPTTAAGAEALFDVFAALPAFQTEEMLEALDNPGPDPRVIWTRRLLH